MLNMTIPITTVPAPHGIPQANAQGKLAAKWLPEDATYYAVEYGVIADGVTDNTIAVNAAIAAAEATGGTVVFPLGVTRCDGQIALPNNGDTPAPRQRGVRLTGSGAFFSGQGTAPYGGSILDLRCSSGAAKIVTFGLGVLEIDRLCITDYGCSNTPFLLSTNTTLLIHDNGFVGNPTKATATCDQDVIILGGLTTTVDGTATSPFQGYGTLIYNNFFDRIRRGVLWQTWANAVVVYDNTIWLHCGGGVDGQAGAFQMKPAAGQYCTGNVIRDNLIECVGYTYGMRLQTAHSNSLISNNFFDAVHITAFILLENDAIYNRVIDGYHPGTKPLVIDQTPLLTNTVEQHGLMQESFYSQPVKFRNVTVNGTFLANLGSSGFRIQPALAQGQSAILMQILRSAAEPIDPGTAIFQVQQNGVVTVGGVYAGSIEFRDQAGAVIAEFANGLKHWRANGSMSQSSGTGGNYFDHRNYGVRFYDHGTNGALRATIGASLDGMTFGAASDTNLYRAAANMLKTDDGLTIMGVFFPQQAVTASAPDYVKGGVYFDTALNKLRVGGVDGWETVNSS